MSEQLSVYVLDTSAWLTLIEDEDGADEIQKLLENAAAGQVILLTSFMSFMEVYYITLQERDHEEAQRSLDLMAALPVLRIESSGNLAVRAATLKADHRVSVADAWIAALAQEHDAILIHKDPEFEQMDSIVQLFSLPYKA